MAPGNPCVPETTMTRRRIASPSATWGSNGWRRLRLFSCFAGLGWLTREPPAHQALTLCTLVGWPLLMFNYLHDRMHINGFWMTRIPVLRSWFLNARRLHDIHHRSVNGKGFVDANFGIGFHFFDRFFRTLARRHRPFNWEGYHAATDRYGLDESELLSLRGCSTALFHKEAETNTALRRT